MVPRQARLTTVSLLALGLVAVGLWHLLGRAPRLLQRDCETAQQWMELNPIRWAVTNGGALGVGFLSRIGLVSFYAVPVACFGFGDPLAGALVFGAYGFARGFAVWGWFLIMNVRRGVAQDHIADRLFEWQYAAKRLSGALLVGTALAATVIVGL